MKEMTIKGRELAVEFDHASQGFRLTAMEYDGNEWQTIPNYDGALFIGSTYFEALCHLSSDLFDEAVHAETMAQLLEIPMITSDDAECVKCGEWGHYSELRGGDAMTQEIANELGATKFDYACYECYETVAAKTVTA